MEKKKRRNPETHVTREIDRYGNDVRGLSDTQLRALQVLCNAQAFTVEDALPLEQIASRAGISPVVMRRGVGQTAAETRIAAERVIGYPSLLTRGEVRLVQLEAGTVYHLTPAGIATVECVRDAISALGPPRGHPDSVRTRSGPTNE